jgi:hypothetical protein
MDLGEYPAWLAQSGHYMKGGVDTDETDWWEVDTSDYGSQGDHYRYQVQVQGEHFVNVEFYDGSAGCPAQLLEIFEIPTCQIKVVLTQCRPRGKYWFRINLADPCGVYYIVSLQDTIYCEPCIVECPQGGVPEGEDCGEDENSGCSPGTGFRDVDIDEIVCGTVWADGGSPDGRDEDWYQFVTDVNAEFVIWTTSEVPVCAVPIIATDENGEQLGQVSCSGPSEWGYWSSCLVECDENEGYHYTTCHPAGTYWLFTAPATLGQDEFPDPIWYSYPCGTSNDYWTQVQLENENCTPE